MLLLGDLLGDEFPEGLEDLGACDYAGNSSDVSPMAGWEVFVVEENIEFQKEFLGFRVFAFDLGHDGAGFDLVFLVLRQQLLEKCRFL